MIHMSNHGHIPYISLFVHHDTDLIYSEVHLEVEYTPMYNYEQRTKSNKYKRNGTYVGHFINGAHNFLFTAMFIFFLSISLQSFNSPPASQ
jgi:hypothetical protein